MQIRFSEPQAAWIAPVWDTWILHYLQARYGRSWQWYWMNWQLNQELLL